MPKIARFYQTGGPDAPEAAGIVDAVGPGVDSKLIGKTMASIPAFSMNQYGVLGEEAIVPARALGEYPEKLSAESNQQIGKVVITVS